MIVRGARVEGRTTLLSAMLLTLSVYVSCFSPYISVLAILLCVLRNVRCLKALPTFAPFLGFFALSSFFLGGLYHSLVMSLATLAMLVSGTLIAYIPSSEFALSLSWIGFPESWAIQIALALRMFRILWKDARRCFEAAKFESRVPHFRAMKAFASVSVLRSVALAETLYCRNYSGRIPGELKKPEIPDLLFLGLSAFVLLLSVAEFLHIKMV